MELNSVTFTPKLMHVVLSLEVGGAEKLIYDMMRHPCFEKNKPIVCCLQKIGCLGEELTKQGFKVYFRERKKRFDVSIIFWLIEIMRNENIDVVHAHQYTPLFYSAPAARLAGAINVVYTEHGRLYPDVRRWKRWLFNPFLALMVDHFVSISESTRQAMVKYDNFPLRRIEVIHNGADLSSMCPSIDLVAKRHSLGIDEYFRIIGTAARLDCVKNLRMMLNVFKKILEHVPDVILLICGTGPQLKELESISQQLEIENSVKFLGLRNDLPEIYQLFEVFLLSSFTEGISITLLEAMATKIPVVVTNVGGNPEVVVEGITGRLVPLNDVEKMADAVIELLENPEIAKAFGCSGRKRAAETFGFDNMLKKYISLYLCSRK